jgi:hypothetical protein
MNVGKLYQAKKYFWFLFPSKDEVATYPAVAGASFTEAVEGADYYSKRFNCNVSYIFPNSIFMLLEQDGYCCKILSTNGELGWINLADWCKADIEEVNQ